MSINISLIVGIAVAALATVLAIVATAIPYWAHAKGGPTPGHLGLWKKCIDALPECMTNEDDYIKSVRAFMIIGIVILAASTAISSMFAFVMHTQKRFATFGSIFGFAGGASCLIAAIIYVVETDATPGWSLFAGFGLAIVAGVLGLVAGALLLLGRRKADSMIMN